ncbi:hypothetical protein M0804_011840 [Polistes exclamans]|nr:hypothetical protein M0804_011840 [Polistes exclamans]
MGIYHFSGLSRDSLSRGQHSAFMTQLLVVLAGFTTPRIKSPTRMPKVVYDKARLRCGCEIDPLRGDKCHYFRRESQEAVITGRAETSGSCGKPKASLDVRRRANFKHLVAAAIREIRAVKSQEDLGNSSSSSDTVRPNQGLSEDRSRLVGESLEDTNTPERPRSEIELEIENIISKIDADVGHNFQILVSIVRKPIGGVDVAESINALLKSVFSPPSGQSGGSRSHVRAPVDSNGITS